MAASPRRISRPSSFFIAYPDHGVIYRFIPLTASTSAMELDLAGARRCARGRRLRSRQADLALARYERGRQADHRRQSERASTRATTSRAPTRRSSPTRSGGSTGISARSAEVVETTFDFVVVGAGSAGCVLAERLSENGRHTVAVIEAGGSDRRFYVQMPLGYGKTFYDRTINWNYAAEPDPGPRRAGRLLATGKAARRVEFDQRDGLDQGRASGFRCLGGRGQSGWAYADVLPFFKQLEHNQAGEDPWRGAGGRLHVSDVSAGLHPSSKGSSQRANRRASRSMPTSTGTVRKVSASIRSRPRTAGACRPPRPSCGRRCGDPMSRSSPGRKRPVSSSRVAAPPASRSCVATRGRPSGRGVRSSLRPARSTRPCCCSFPASALRSTSRRSAYR